MAYPLIKPGCHQDEQREEKLMKYIIAIIKPGKLDDIRRELSGVGITGMTITEVKGFGRQKGHKELYRGAEYTIDFLPKVKVEVAVDDSLADQAVSIFTSAARTEKIGDGKIFVLDLSEAIRIRTGEAGSEAL
jgi:nitrogen regulatory protein P-II 2